jgi:hypothetical protein
VTRHTRLISAFRVSPGPFPLLRRHPTMDPGLEKSRLAVTDEVKFDMLAAISDSGDHAKQYKSISRNLVCEHSSPFIAISYLKHEA